MILYHGSNVEVRSPKILTTNRALDFGAGFYATSSLEQAKRWAVLQSRRRREGRPTVSVYAWPDDVTDLSELRFAEPGEAWLDYVIANRRQVFVGEVFDLVIGPVANDRTMAGINDYATGNIDKRTALILLEPQRLTDQYCFKTARALKRLTCTEVLLDE